MQYILNNRIVPLSRELCLLVIHFKPGVVDGIKLCLLKPREPYGSDSASMQVTCCYFSVKVPREWRVAESATDVLPQKYSHRGREG